MKTPNDQRKIVAIMLCVGAGAALVAGPFSVRGEEFNLGGRVLKAPSGFTIERMAGPPLVDRPITAAFDEHGRLYVADSSGSNDNVQKQLAERPHRIVRLEDRDGDGMFDARTIFADKMMFPEGTMWHDGSLYVSAPPSIWKLTDTDGDGVADQRVEWFQGKTLTGCANDLHGPYLGPDGWIYWAKGAFAKQTYDRPGRALSDSQQNPIFEDTLDEVFGSRRSAFERDQSFGKHGYQPPADHICYERTWRVAFRDGFLRVIIPD